MGKLIPDSWTVPPWCDAEFGGGILDEKVHVAVGRNQVGQAVLHIDDGDEHIICLSPEALLRLVEILQRAAKVMGTEPVR